LLVIDPIMAFLDRHVHANHDQSVRNALWPVAALAAKYRCAVILIRHLNKLGHRSTLYRGSWLFERDPTDGTRHVMAQIKNKRKAAEALLRFFTNSQLARSWFRSAGSK
jgi:hypothetical protein